MTFTEDIKVKEFVDVRVIDKKGKSKKEENKDEKKDEKNRDG